MKTKKNKKNMDLIEIEKNEKEGTKKIKVNVWGLFIVSLAMSLLIPNIIIEKYEN